MLQQVVEAIPDFKALPAFDELHARTQALKLRGDAAVSVRTLGHSESGMPIELVSIGAGPLSVLLVGAPHPNEPVGCLTIEFLIDHLLRDPDFLEATGCSWHFIKAIEPDALRMNEGWFKHPGDPVAYLRHFYRPALADQAEYGFPLSMPGYHFEASKPENLAYQEAIKLTQPDLLFSLHNAEFGGVFYLITHDVNGLCAELAVQPPTFGLTLDEIGEPTAQGQTFAPGVFESPNTRKFAAAAGFYNAGQSAFDHAKEAHGTLGLMAEIPYWQPKRTGASAEERTVAEIFAPLVAQIQAVQQLAARHQAVHEQLVSPTEVRLSRAIQENLTFLQMYRDMYSNLPEGKYSPGDAAVHSQAMGLLTLRPVSMLARLSALLLARRGEDAALKAARDEVSAFLDVASRAVGDMEVVPLRTTVAVQVVAALSAARALSRKAAAAPVTPNQPG